ncbi:MAG: hypothetical protein MUC48_00970 [Leptolyngbya sp. Prado105]|jgi:hypothetical protein|nr:hypothetical protein [Leptolyngbya sp. Prado105]
MQTIPNFCFCTLAIGNRYRQHALLLAADLERYSPNTPFIVLTDKPQAFQQQYNTKAFLHRLQSVGGYHDKRFVIEKALSFAESCIFLDSDMRILGAVPTKMEFAPGLTARTGCNILKQNAGYPDLIALIQQTAKDRQIDLDQVDWFHEFMFVVTRQNGIEKIFLNLWAELAEDFELQGFYNYEANVIALALAQSGFDFQIEFYDRFPFFKDKIEQVRIQNQQSSLEDKRLYFDIQKQIEFPQRSLPRKVYEKSTKTIAHLYRLGKLKLRHL